MIYSGPHAINNQPVIVKAWEAGFNFYEEVLRTIPLLWVKLQNLPFNCWSMESMTRIGSGLGNPLYADYCTTKIQRISYAHMLIEMDVTKPLPQLMIMVEDPNGRIF